LSAAGFEALSSSLGSQAMSPTATSVYCWPLAESSYGQSLPPTGEDATAVAYVQLRAGNCNVYGVGLDPNIVTATLKAVVAAANRACAQRAVALTAPVGACAA